MAETRSGAVTLKGNPVNLAGKALKAGDTAPEFKLQGTDLAEVTLASSKGKTRIVATSVTDRADGSPKLTWRRPFPSRPAGTEWAREPVVQVSFKDAEAFARWLQAHCLALGVEARASGTR